MKRFLAAYLVAGTAVCLLWITPVQVRAREPQQRTLGTEMGYEIFQKNCMMCHGNPDSTAHAPEVSTLRQMSPEAIYAAMTTGPMAVQGQKLTEEEKVRVAEALSNRPLHGGEAGDAPARRAVDPVYGRETGQCPDPRQPGRSRVGLRRVLLRPADPKLFHPELFADRDR